VQVVKLMICDSVICDVARADHAQVLPTRPVHAQVVNAQDIHAQVVLAKVMHDSSISCP